LLQVWITKVSIIVNLAISQTTGNLPMLEHGLDKVLKHRGPQFLIDPITKNHLFEPYLEKLPQLSDIDLTKLAPFIRVSQDRVTIINVGLASTHKGFWCSDLLLHFFHQ
jgi:hypothetical protein